MLINSVLRRIWVTFQLSCLISVVGKVLRRVFSELFDVWSGFSAVIKQILTPGMIYPPGLPKLCAEALSFSEKSLAIFRLKEVKKRQKEIILHVIESVV